MLSSSSLDSFSEIGACSYSASAERTLRDVLLMSTHNPFYGLEEHWEFLQVHMRKHSGLKTRKCCFQIMVSTLLIIKHLSFLSLQSLFLHLKWDIVFCPSYLTGLLWWCDGYVKYIYMCIYIQTHTHTHIYIMIFFLFSFFFFNFILFLNLT